MPPPTTPGFADRCQLAAAIARVIANRILIRTGLRKRRDGWRRGAGLVLKEETAGFMLSALGLEVWPKGQTPENPDARAAQRHVETRLAEFLAGEHVTHVSIRRGAREHVVEAMDEPSYTLTFQNWDGGTHRFVPPVNWGTSATNGRDPLLKFVARVMPDGRAVDLWVRINHVGIDGVPAQEVLSRLEAAWGTRDVAYPMAVEFAAHEGVRPCASGRACIAEVQLFLDFGPVQAWRKKTNASLSEPMTVSAAILWWLAKHKAFAGIYMGTTVDVPATADGMGRGVGLVVIRPTDYFGRSRGLARYVQDFNRVLKQIKTRTSESFKILDSAAHLPPNLSRRLLCHALESGGPAFGSLGVSIIKEGKIFGAPIGDVGQAHGFLAIGSVTLPTADGRRVGCVMVKGAVEKIAEYPRFLREALGICAD